MLTYEQFEKYINEIQKADEKSAKIAAALDRCDAIYDASAIGTAVDLLSLAMEDTSGWIGYWFFEKNYGKEWEADTVYEADGTPVVCKTVRQLYDFLVKEARDDLMTGVYPPAISEYAIRLPADKQEKLKDAMKTYCEICDYINDNLAAQQNRD